MEEQKASKEKRKKGSEREKEKKTNEVDDTYCSYFRFYSLFSLYAFNLPGGRQMFAPLPLDCTTHLWPLDHLSLTLSSLTLLPHPDRFQPSDSKHIPRFTYVHIYIHTCIYVRQICSVEYLCLCLFAVGVLVCVYINIHVSTPASITLVKHIILSDFDSEMLRWTVTSNIDRF